MLDERRDELIDLWLGHVPVKRDGAQDAIALPGLKNFLPTRFHDPLLGFTDPFE